MDTNYFEKEAREQAQRLFPRLLHYSGSERKAFEDGARFGREQMLRAVLEELNVGAMGELRRLVVVGAKTGEFPVTGPNYWANWLEARLKEKA